MNQKSASIEIEPVLAEFEAVSEVPQKQYVEKIIEITEVEYVDTPYERIIEVPVIVEEEIKKQVLVPKYVRKPVPQIKEVMVPHPIKRKIPAPVEAEIQVNVNVGVLNPKYKNCEYQVVLPRFIECPIPIEIAEQTFMNTSINTELLNFSKLSEPCSMQSIERAMQSALELKTERYGDQTFVSERVKDSIESGIIKLAP